MIHPPVHMQFVKYNRYHFKHLQILIKDEKDKEIGKLILVDLAGSERA